MKELIGRAHNLCPGDVIFLTTIGWVTVEQVWLPVLGPTSVALLRACPLLWAIAAPYEADDQDIAHMLGLGGGSRLRDVCKRLARFRVANWDPTTGSLQVRTHLPDLTATQLARCPEHTRGLHCNS